MRPWLKAKPRPHRKIEATGEINRSSKREERAFARTPREESYKDLLSRRGSDVMLLFVGRVKIIMCQVMPRDPVDLGSSFHAVNGLREAGRR